MRETQRHDPERGAEGFAQQSRGVELLKPLGDAHVGLLAGKAFHMKGVDQIHVNARFGQNIIKRDPVVTGAFHGGGLDTALQHPVAQCMHSAGESGVGADGVFAAAWRHGHDKFLGPNVDASRIRVGLGVDGMLRACTLLAGTAGGGFATG